MTSEGVTNPTNHLEGICSWIEKHNNLDISPSKYPLWQSPHTSDCGLNLKDKIWEMISQVCSLHLDSDHHNGFAHSKEMDKKKKKVQFVNHTENQTVYFCKNSEPNRRFLDFGNFCHCRCWEQKVKSCERQRRPNHPEWWLTFGGPGVHRGPEPTRIKGRKIFSRPGSSAPAYSIPVVWPEGYPQEVPPSHPELLGSASSFDANQPRSFPIPWWGLLSAVHSELQSCITGTGSLDWLSLPLPPSQDERNWWNTNVYSVFDTIFKATCLQRAARCIARVHRKECRFNLPANIIAANGLLELATELEAFYQDVEKMRQEQEEKRQRSQETALRHQDTTPEHLRNQSTALSRKLRVLLSGYQDSTAMTTSFNEAHNFTTSMLDTIRLMKTDLVNLICKDAPAPSSSSSCYPESPAPLSPSPLQILLTKSEALLSCLDYLEAQATDYRSALAHNEKLLIERNLKICAASREVLTKKARISMVFVMFEKDNQSEISEYGDKVKEFAKQIRGLRGEVLEPLGVRWVENLKLIRDVHVSGVSRMEGAEEAVREDEKAGEQRRREGEMVNTGREGEKMEEKEKEEMGNEKAKEKGKDGKTLRDMLSELLML